MGARWDSDPRSPRPQRGAFPLSYEHHMGIFYIKNTLLARFVLGVDIIVGKIIMDYGKSA